MYILKNAFVSIKRNKGRNLLIGIIMVVIALACSVTLAIRSSANSLIESYENQYEVEATIGVNRESMKGQMDPKSKPEEEENVKENMQDIFNSINSLTADEIATYGDSKYVEYFYYEKSVGVDTDLEVVSTDTFGGENMPSMPGGDKEKENLSDTDFTLKGYSSTESMEEFISGKYKITDGEVSTDLESENCVINSELATLNELEVGDKITLTDPDNEDNSITLTITGIFEENSEENGMEMFTSSANMIITNVNMVDKLAKQNEDMNVSVNPTFILTSKDVIESFEEELQEKGLSEYLSVTTNLDQVERATSTISNVSTFALTFLIITLIIGAIVLLVINMINIRERKYEIGVLRTIGMKKSLLALQFMSELLMITLVSLVIGTILGSLVSVEVSNSLLENEITNASEEISNINENFGGGKEPRFDKVNGIASVQAFDSIDAVVDTKVLLQLFGIGIILTIISSLAAMISIERFSPLTILKERS